MDTSAYNNIEGAEWNALHAGTEVTVVFDSSCDYTGGTETDVSWDTVDLPGSVRGSTYCEDYDDGHCDQFYAELDLVELAKGVEDELDVTKTACHELGHTVGLTHHASGYGCMLSGELPSVSLEWRRYVQHHKDHINYWFNEV